MRTPLVLCVFLTACAPVREEIPEGEGGGGSSHESAIFLEWGQGAREYRIGAVHLVDGEYGCDGVFNLEVDWWSLAADTAWVSLTVLKGVEHASWEADYPSYLAFEREGDFDYTDALYFHGSFGFGGNGGGDDDEPPPPLGRDVRGYLGQEQSQLDDSVSITSFSDTRVTGTAVGTRTVDGQVEDYDLRFSAENCGIVDGGVVVGR